MDTCVWSHQWALLPSDLGLIPPLWDPPFTLRRWEGRRVIRKDNEVLWLNLFRVTSNKGPYCSLRKASSINSLFSSQFSLPLYPLWLGGGVRALLQPLALWYPLFFPYIQLIFSYTVQLLNIPQIFPSLICCVFPLGTLNNTFPYSS